MRLSVLLLVVMISPYCEACSVTFVHHGPGLKANLPYWTGSLSLADCQKSCKEDISCGGIAYNPSSSECTKTGRSQSRLNPQCPTCTFYHKQCGTDCSLIYTDFLSNEIANPSYTSLTVSNFDLCLACCTSDVQCVGVGYDSSQATAQCMLSKNNFPLTASCSTCRFSSKSCSSSGPDVFNPTTIPPTTSNDVTTQISITSPIDITTQDANTSPNDVTTQVTNTSPIYVTILNGYTSPADVTTQDSNTSPNDGTTQGRNTSPSNVTTQDSETSSTDFMNQLSSTDELTTQDTSPHDNTIPNYHTYSTIVHQSSTTTMTESKSVTTSEIAISSVSYNMHSTSESVVENPSTLCICHCYEDANKTTLVEWTSNMRRNLLISKKILSSQTRKLKSATDPRFSSYVIGMSGISILVGFGVFFLLFDVSNMFAYIFNTGEPQTPRLNRH